MPTVVRMDAMKDLRAKLDQYAEMTGSQFDGLGLDELGDLHRFLRLATAEIEEALVPAMVNVMSVSSAPEVMITRRATSSVATPPRPQVRRATVACVARLPRR